MAKLHIVIPTYNRSRKLASTLSALKSQVNDHLVTIFDNCSTDTTQSFCEQFCISNLNFHYVRREANIGANGNILLSVIEGIRSGDMLWILPDDDEIDEIGVKVVNDLILRLSVDELPDAIVVGACSNKSEQENWPFAGPRVIKDGVIEFWRHASFLPSLILNAKRVKKCIIPDLFYIGGCYSQMLLFRYLFDDNVNVLTMPVRVIYRGYGGTVHPSIPWWMLSWLRVTQYFPVNYRNAARKAVVGRFRTLPLRYIKALAFNPVEKGSTMSVNYYDFISQFDGWRYLYVMMWWPFSLVPRGLIRSLINFLRWHNIGSEIQSLSRT